MTRIVIELEVPPEAEEGFRHGKRAFVVPLSETETARLGTDIILTHDGLAVIADSRLAFVEGRELYGKPDPELKSAIEGMAGQLRELWERQGRTREVLRRAVFVDVYPKTRKGNAGEDARRKSAEAAADGLMKHFGIPPKKGPVQ